MIEKKKNEANNQQSRRRRMRQTKAVCLVGDLLSSFSCSKYITPMIDQTDVLNKFTGPTKTTTNNSYYELIVVLLPKKSN